MKISLPASVAWRYLWSKKSHSAVGTISVISVCGMAVAAAAIICVLSVFNGFKAVIAERLDTLTPDVIVTPAKGKVFDDAESLATRISKMTEVEIASPTLTDNALVIFNTSEIPVLLKGVVRPEYERITSVRSLLVDSAVNRSAESGALMSIGTASRLAAVAGEKLLLFTPRREGRLNPANPAASFLTDSVPVEAIFRTQQSDFDDNLVIVDIETARELLQYDAEASAIEVKAVSGTDPAKLAGKISAAVGDGFIVKDRFRQQEMNFRMVSIEKWVSFLLLFFILVIASFNIISSLSMLVLDKQRNLSTFMAMGLSRSETGAIFWWESIYVALIGGFSGIVLGSGLVLLQQHSGLIKIYSDAFESTPYPVALEGGDIMVTLVPIVVIALAAAWVTSAFARNRSHDRPA